MATDKTAAFYEEMHLQIKSILDPQLPIVSNLSNVASIMFWNLNENERQVNWAGFYFLDPSKGKLFLGPFQGKVACTIIPLGKGVVGTSAAEKASVIVENVHNFPGHIACDSASESEIVVPMISAVDDTLIGVIDVDALRTSEFTTVDRIGLERIAKTLAGFIDETKAKDLILR